MSEQIIQKQLNSTWNGWKLNELLGEGSYGKVYRITREEFGHTYEAALKVITIPRSKAELKSVMEDGVDGKSLTTYFYSIVEDVVKEFVLMSEMKGNTNIVSYEDHAVVPLEGTIGWNILIRMELLTPLMEYLRSKKMTVRDAVKLGIDISRALEICSKNDIIHRDIKPDNIFVSKFGDYKLGDFGIARQLEKTSGNMTKRGTVNYMAPEVYKGDPYNRTVDIYSLGIVLYRLLNKNRLPFMPPYPAKIKYTDKEAAVSMRMAGETLPCPCSAKGEISRIILKACAYDPADRYQNAREMRKDLEEILAGNTKKDLQNEKTVFDSNYLDKTGSTGSSESNRSKVEETMVLDKDRQEDDKTVLLKDKRSNSKIVPLVLVAIVLAGVLIFRTIDSNKTVTVPQLKEISLEDAKNKAGEVGIKIVADNLEYSDTVEEGMVISQDINEGDSVKKGSNVRVVVSKGKMPVIPSVVGVSLNEGKTVINEAGFEMGNVEQQYSDDIPNGNIISQSPDEGVQAEPGTEISIVVSMGTNKIEVPDLKGSSIDGVKTILESLGLKYSYTEEYSSESAGTIIEQAPTPGEKVNEGTEIKLVVSLGEEPTTEAATQAQRQQTTKKKEKSTEQSTQSKKKKSGDDVDSWDVVN